MRTMYAWRSAIRVWESGFGIYFYSPYMFVFLVVGLDFSGFACPQASLADVPSHFLPDVSRCTFCPHLTL